MRPWERAVLRWIEPRVAKIAYGITAALFLFTGLLAWDSARRNEPFFAVPATDRAVEYRQERSRAMWQERVAWADNPFPRTWTLDCNPMRPGALLAGNAFEYFAWIEKLYRQLPADRSAEDRLALVYDFVGSRWEDELAGIDRDLQRRETPPRLKEDWAEALAWLAGLCRMTPAELYAESLRLRQRGGRGFYSLAYDLVLSARTYGYRDPEIIEFETKIGTPEGRTKAARDFLRLYAESGHLGAQREMIRIAEGADGDPVNRIGAYYWRYRAECYGEGKCKPILREIRAKFSRNEQIDIAWALESGDSYRVMESIEYRREHGPPPQP